MSTPVSAAQARVTPVPEELLHPALQPWSRTWRYLLAVLGGLVAWSATSVEQLSAMPSGPRQDLIGMWLVADLLLGAFAVALLPQRRKHPFLVACVTIAISSFSTATFGAATLAVVSMATWRRRRWVVVTALAWFVSGLVSAFVYRARGLAPTDDNLYAQAANQLLSLVFFGLAIVTGFYVRARRELVASLHERLLTAEREQALTTEAARDAERTRIAREMHDVLAHRISLVAMHAGALAYREDLTREQTAETAATIQANAQLALAELRQVLGVLRAGRVSDGVEAPQPTLAELPALLADVREAGSQVQLDVLGLGECDLSKLPVTVSRTSFRIVQEALTNARKHAPGEPVSVRLSGEPAGILEVEVRNRVGVAVGATGTSGAPPGVGLTGMTERAELAGGALTYGGQPDGSFLVRARLPWNS
ncbi:sensor histidine kinase [Cellulomonas sp. URHD0024]|uniref:sensor histidine kinase n=1 Tax=Cellulomonas sp. URHD0024 TaxID=1302620 RepID=UPI00040761F9|nr:sensor histidine kinase [Cellulomonas sp. URHD0024]